MTGIPSINIFSRDVVRLADFYERVGFRETYRYPQDGAPTQVEVNLDQFTIRISSVEAAIKDHGLNPNLGGRTIGAILRTDDTDREYACLTGKGAWSLRPPHDFLTDLRTAWKSDPDGNPINLVQRRSKRNGAR
ncbi:MAG: glyoxalase/bleomycin resistance/dioxygenase family protein [archaeon]|nr:glyoxalase/bleomycin resistance/dioxygenase family protein [archaeon]